MTDMWVVLVPTTTQKSVIASSLEGVTLEKTSHPNSLDLTLTPTPTVTLRLVGCEVYSKVMPIREAKVYLFG